MHPLRPIRQYVEPLTAQTVQHLQQEGAEDFLRGNRGPTGSDIQIRQLWRQGGQGHIQMEELQHNLLFRWFVGLDLWMRPYGM